MSKIRMILADDEPVILRGLRMIVDWDALGIEVVGEAYDGKELLALMEVCRPELIVSDICMPNLSGIEVLKQIETSQRNVQVIFISAYREFSYAQDALKYGALDYLIKPVDTLQLEQVLKKAVLTIRSASEEVRKREKLQQLERHVHDSSIEELLDRLTDGDSQAGRILDDLLELDPDKHLTVCVGEWKGELSGDGRWQERERKLIDFAVRNVMMDILKVHREGYFFRKGAAFCFLLLSDHPEKPMQVALEVRDSVQTYLKLSMTMGVGGPAPDIQGTADSYRQAIQALERGYFYGLGRVILYEPTSSADESMPALAELQAQLLDELLSPVPDALPGKTRERWLQAVRSFAACNKHKAVSQIYSTLAALRQEISRTGIALPHLDTSFEGLLEHINSLDTFTEVESYACNFLQSIQQSVQARLGNKESQQIIQVKEYIEKHYRDNITLESIAALIYMNQSYFSTFFKKHTGTNFKHYVTEVRMKQARRLLLHSDMMVYEVAEQVGYQNARLFSEVFKKMFGQLPQDYKQRKGASSDAADL